MYGKGCVMAVGGMDAHVHTQLTDTRRYNTTQYRSNNWTEITLLKSRKSHNIVR